MTAVAPPALDRELETEAINALRVLSIDAVQAANSGHPGLPMGAAPMAYVLWTEFLHSIPKTRTGRTATASSSPPATARRCSTACSI